jgi:integrase
VARVLDEDELIEHWTLHDLRHSALTHAAENGANTGSLLAYSGGVLVTSRIQLSRILFGQLRDYDSR